MPEARFCESPPGISNGFRVANRIRRKPIRSNNNVNKILLTVIVLPAINVAVITAIALQSSIGTCALMVLLCLTAMSCAIALTRAGAQAEVDARGLGSTPFCVVMVAHGKATLSHKLAVVSLTVMGAFMSPLWIVISLVIGGILKALGLHSAVKTILLLIGLAGGYFLLFAATCVASVAAIYWLYRTIGAKGRAIGVLCVLGMLPIMALTYYDARKPKVGATQVEPLATPMPTPAPVYWQHNEIVATSPDRKSFVTVPTDDSGTPVKTQPTPEKTDHEKELADAWKVVFDYAGSGKDEEFGLALEKYKAIESGKQPEVRKAIPVNKEPEVRKAIPVNKT
jgi:hypothetical protein